MFEYEQETYGSKGRERIRAAAMAHTGKKGKAAEKQAAPVNSAVEEALPWEREDAPGRDYQSTWNQF